MNRNLLLSGGPAHDFGATSHSLSCLFDEIGIETTIVDGPAAAIQLLRSAEAGVVERFNLLTVNALHWGMDAEPYAQLRDEHGFTFEASDAAVIQHFIADGGGLLALHTAVICFDAEPTWHALCGASWTWGTSFHRPLGDATVTVTDEGHRHVITEGFDDFTVRDEVYECLDANPSITPLLSTATGSGVRPLLWVQDFGAGRVVTDLLGHGLESVEHPTHRAILRRAATWASARTPISS